MPDALRKGRAAYLGTSFPDRSIFLLMAVLLTAACTAGPRASLGDRTLAFGCNDVIVVGRIENGALQPATSQHDLLGHGWISATLKVRKVIRGSGVPSVLPAKYFAHTYMRQDRDFMLVLARTRDGGYEINTGQPMALRPRLADRCQ